MQLSLTTNFLLPTTLDFYSNCRCQCEQSLASRPSCFSLTFQGVVTRHAAEPTVFGRQSLASFQVRPSIVSIIPRAQASVVYPCHGSKQSRRAISGPCAWPYLHQPSQGLIAEAATTQAQPKHGALDPWHTVSRPGQVLLGTSSWTDIGSKLPSTRDPRAPKTVCQACNAPASPPKPQPPGWSPGQARMGKTRHLRQRTPRGLLVASRRRGRFPTSRFPLSRFKHEPTLCFICCSPRPTSITSRRFPLCRIVGSSWKPLRSIHPSIVDR